MDGRDSQTIIEMEGKYYKKEEKSALDNIQILILVYIS